MKCASSSALKRQGEHMVKNDFPSLSYTILQMGKYDDNFVEEGQELQYAEAEDDTSIVSDDTGSSPLNYNILISPRLNEFSERTWWMVDMFEQDDEEEGSATTQGATALVKRCIRVYGWDLQKTRKVLSAYKQFLTLEKIFKDPMQHLLSPSLLVDQIWHQHILDVVNYSHDMCYFVDVWLVIIQTGQVMRRRQRGMQRHVMHLNSVFQTSMIKKFGGWHR